MKTLISTSLLLLLLVFSSCKKGKKLSNHLSVRFVPLSTASVYPNGDFTFYDTPDPLNPNYYAETTVSPEYVDGYTGSGINADFNKMLTEYLADNNIGLVDSNEDYELRITRCTSGSRWTGIPISTAAR